MKNEPARFAPFVLWPERTADVLVDRVRTAFVERTPGAVFVDLRPDGLPPGPAMWIAGHLWNGACEQCGLPSSVVKRQPGDVRWPFGVGVWDCDRWPEFLAPDPHRVVS